MRVVLHDEIFAEGASAVTDLVRLFACGWRGPHALETDPPTLIEPGQFIHYPPMLNSWLRCQSSSLQSECETALALGPIRIAEQMPVRSIHVVLNAQTKEGSTPALSVPAAVRFLTLPLLLKVENKINDRRFIIATAPSEWKTKIEEFEQERWLRFDHGGGGDLHTQLEHLAQDSDECMRTFVVADSDALRRGLPSAQAKALKSKCDQLGIPIHLLYRRAIENYIPLPLLRAWAYRHGDPAEQHKRQRLVDALSQLLEEQRHHYFMKQGFAGEAKRNDLAKNQADLFQGLPPDVYDALAHGFGNQICELFDSTLYQHKESWFLQDDTQGEIVPFLNNLLRYI